MFQFYDRSCLVSEHFFVREYCNKDDYCYHNVLISNKRSTIFNLLTVVFSFGGTEDVVLDLRCF